MLHTIIKTNYSRNNTVFAAIQKRFWNYNQ